MDSDLLIITLLALGIALAISGILAVTSSTFPEESDKEAAALPSSTAPSAAGGMRQRIAALLQHGRDVRRKGWFRFIISVLLAWCTLLTRSVFSERVLNAQNERDVALAGLVIAIILALFYGLTVIPAGKVRALVAAALLVVFGFGLGRLDVSTLFPLPPTPTPPITPSATTTLSPVTPAPISVSFDPTRILPTPGLLCSTNSNASLLEEARNDRPISEYPPAGADRLAVPALLSGSGAVANVIGKQNVYILLESSSPATLFAFNGTAYALCWFWVPRGVVLISEDQFNALNEVECQSDCPS